MARTPPANSPPGGARARARARTIGLFLCLLPGLSLTAAFPAEAQVAMTEAEFEAYVTGKTIAYDRGGRFFGEEQYYPDRKVIWAFDGDVCTFGYWYAERGLICFAYDGQEREPCWNFWLENGRLAALIEGGTPAETLYGNRESASRIECPLPGLGM